MSDSQPQGGAQDMAQSAAPAGPTAGALLREAREAAGLHIAALALSLKVPVRKLEALEADRYDLLPDAVFVRALASSVCRTLKMDPAPVLDRLPQTSAPRLAQDAGGINAPFRAPGDSRGPSWIDQLSRPVFLAVFALLLGAAVVVGVSDYIIRPRLVGGHNEAPALLTFVALFGGLRRRRGAPAFTLLRQQIAHDSALLRQGLAHG